jgi:Alcohol dehydrogenase GroES-like domain
VLVDDLRELRDRLQRAVFAPPGDVGDALAVDGEPDTGAYDEGHDLDDDPRLLVGVCLKVHAEGAGDFITTTEGLPPSLSTTLDGLPWPLIPGHEAAGTMLEVGAAVTHLAVGQRVAVVVSERQQGTLEPVLITPISPEEFLVGKALAVLIPTLAVSYGVFGSSLRRTLCSLTPVSSRRSSGSHIPVSLLFTPLLAGWSIWVGIAISTRSTDIRAAQ